MAGGAPDDGELLTYGSGDRRVGLYDAGDRVALGLRADPRSDGGTDAALGRAVRRGERCTDGRLHALDRDRRRDGARRPRRLGRPRPRARAGRAADARRGRDALVEGLDGLAGGGRGGHARLGPGPRGRPHEPRGGARRADRAGRRQAPHRSLAQRPGRDGPAPLAPPGDRPARRGDPRAWSARSSAWPSATARRFSPGRPTSSRLSRSSSPTTSSPTSRCSSATAAGSPTAGAGRT